MLLIVGRTQDLCYNEMIVQMNKKRTANFNLNTITIDYTRKSHSLTAQKRPIVSRY